MSLKKFYGLNEEDLSNGVPQAIHGDEPTQPNLSKLFPLPPPRKAAAGGQQAKQAGEGPLSNGVPQAMVGGVREPGDAKFNDQAPGETVPVGLDKTQPVAIQRPDRQMGQSLTIPNPRPNVGGTGQPPKGGPFAKAPNSPDAEDDRLPDLPLESRSLGKMFGIRQENVLTVPRRAGKLAELYAIDEMPRPKGSYSPIMLQALKWAQERGGTEFNGRDIYRVWRQAGGQPNQPDENKAYQSFVSLLKKFVDPRGRGTPEQPLVMVQQGMRGSHGSNSVYSWGAVRASKSPAAKAPGKSPFDDMELGPAGNGQAQPEPEMQAADQGDEMEPAQDEPTAAEPDETEPEDAEQGDEEPSTDDELDWIPPTGSPDDDGVSGAMGRLAEEQPDKLQELLMAVYDAKGTMEAGMKALQIFGRGKARTRDAILVAKTCALNLGKPDDVG